MERAAQRAEARFRMLVLTGVFAAMACTATMVIRIPSPTTGYVNLGDTIVLLGAYLLGPGYGAAAAGIGTALADLLGGYPVYVPATLVIKAVMAALAGLLYRKGMGKGMPGLVACGLIGEIPMVAGYWLYDGLLMSSLAGSAAGIPGNLVQAGFGIAASTLLTAALRKSTFVRREFPTL